MGDPLAGIQSLLLAHARQLRGGRCDADSTTVQPVEKEGRFFDLARFDEKEFVKEQKKVCADALDAVRKRCSDACTLFSKLDENKKRTDKACAWDQESRTSATVSSKSQLGANFHILVAPTCTAGITCLCDP